MYIKPLPKEPLIRPLKDRPFPLIRPVATRVELAQASIKQDQDRDQEFTKAELALEFISQEFLAPPDPTSKELIKALPISHIRATTPTKALPTRVEQAQAATLVKVEPAAALVSLAPASIARALPIDTKRNDAIHD